MLLGSAPLLACSACLPASERSKAAFRRAATRKRSNFGVEGPKTGQEEVEVGKGGPTSEARHGWADAGRASEQVEQTGKKENSKGGRPGFRARV
ncbi:unnamed protein product [Calypogeia fissa]